MTLNTTLQIFLFLQVFLAGILVTIAWRHAKEHYRQSPTNSGGLGPDQPSIALTPQMKQHILRESEEKYEAAAKQSASQLQDELAASGKQVKELVNRLATEIVADEMQRYRTELARMRSDANIQMSATNAEIEKHKEEIKAKVTQEMDAEKQRLLKQIDTRLGDAVSSFLLEALQHNVDLGNQSSYLVALLEEHKDEFKKEVADETPAG